METTYAIAGSVFFNGSSYISLIASNLNNQPDVSPSQWALLAQQGGVGAQGPAGTDGAQGPMGPQGFEGPVGPQGAQGSQGIPGNQGPAGQTGMDGAPGAQGNQGPAGQNGMDGAPGGPGPTGPAGPAGLNFRTAWNIATAYSAADGVSFGGSSYIALQANTGVEPDTDVVGSGGNWALLAQRGAIATMQSLHDLSNVSVGTIKYPNPTGSKIDDATNELGEDVTLAPLACTATTITVKADSSVAPSVAVTYTLRVGTTITATGVGVASSDLADTALSCQISGSNVCSASASVPVAANAIFDISANVQSVGEGASTTPIVHDVAIALVCQ